MTAGGRLPGPPSSGPGRTALALSAALHGLLLLVAWLGLPAFLSPPPPVSAAALEVELAFAPPAARAPEKPQAPEPVPAPEAVKAPEPEPEPVPETVSRPEPAPEPEPLPEPVKKPVAAAPEPAPVKPAASPKPVPKPAPQTAVKPPAPKPEAPGQDSFAALLKTVEKLKPAAPPPRPAAPPEPAAKPPEDLRNILATLRPGGAADRAPAAAPGSRGALSADELDAVKRQIAGCWNIQPGARDAEGLVVRLRVGMNPDRSVRSVTILDGGGDAANPFWQAAARSARTAVLKCSPLKLPAGKYDVWRVVTFVFNPKEMFGL